MIMIAIWRHFGLRSKTPLEWCRPAQAWVPTVDDYACGFKPPKYPVPAIRYEVERSWSYTFLIQEAKDGYGLFHIVHQTWSW